MPAFLSLVLSLSWVTQYKILEIENSQITVQIIFVKVWWSSWLSIVRDVRGFFLSKISHSFLLCISQRYIIIHIHLQLWTINLHRIITNTRIRQCGHCHLSCNLQSNFFEKDVSHFVLQQQPNCREAKTRKAAPVGKMAAGCNLENDDVKHLLKDIWT